MTTIDEKVDLFAKAVLGKAGKQADEKSKQTDEQVKKQYSAEESRIHDSARQIVEERVKRAETANIQIVSKARMKARQNLLRKNEEMADRVLAGLKKRAAAFAKTPGYESFLRYSIGQVLAGLEGEQQLMFYFTEEDLSHNTGWIRSAIVEKLQSNAVYTLHEASGGILGGCICSNGEQTRRVDFSIASLLADNRERIGRIITDHSSGWCQNGEQ